ncbi:transmembrane protein 267 [Bacillus rossius redtenbacheri]|uniref:transmembrane protein 267 n=1 Tax=Bacillus rossius redtenbacheri TaxID=93214 RepID=UPI002FDC8D20
MLLKFREIWTLKVFSPFLIALVAITGDRCVSSPRLNQLQRAILDNLTHAVIGFETWYFVTVYCFCKYRLAHELLESFLCGVISSLIDVDHFIAARSLHLKDAVRLESRPFLHCTSALLAACGALLLAGRACGVPGLHRAGCLAAAAVLSHHLRDAARRGLCLWPLGSTAPLPYGVYVGLCASLPLAVAALLSLGRRAESRCVDVWEA